MDLLCKTRALPPLLYLVHAPCLICEGKQLSSCPEYYNNISILVGVKSLALVMIFFSFSFLYLSHTWLWSELTTAFLLRDSFLAVLSNHLQSWGSSWGQLRARAELYPCTFSLVLLWFLSSVSRKQLFCAFPNLIIEECGTDTLSSLGKAL